jgi:hypothetical protein
MSPDRRAPDFHQARWLAIECTTEACSVALFEDGALIAGEYRQLGRGHAEALVPMIAALPIAVRPRRLPSGVGRAASRACASALLRRGRWAWHGARPFWAIPHWR